MTEPPNWKTSIPWNAEWLESIDRAQRFTARSARTSCLEAADRLHARSGATAVQPNTAYVNSIPTGASR